MTPVSLRRSDARRSRLVCNAALERESLATFRQRFAGAEQKHAPRRQRIRSAAQNIEARFVIEGGEHMREHNDVELSELARMLHQIVLLEPHARAPQVFARELQIVVDGQAETAYGTACQQPDGSWEIING